MWHSTGVTSPITYLIPAPSPYSSSSSTSSRTFAVAYNDGSIRLWSYDLQNPHIEASELVTFNGHKKTVTTLSFDSDGTRLGSGGSEGEIVIWDRIAEVGLFRLKGHSAPVTGLAFIPHPTHGTAQHPGYLVSVARDSTLKLWDMGLQHCVQTVVVGGEVWSLATKEDVEEDNEEDAEIGGRWLLLTGSSHGEAKVWSLSRRVLIRTLQDRANADEEVSGFTSQNCLTSL